MCWPFLHDWDEWEPVIEEHVVKHGIVWVRRFQHRQCINCGKAQEREVARMRAATNASYNASHSGPKQYRADGFCDHCDKDTLHDYQDSGHERDSSGDKRTCLECKWVWSGYTGEYEPPFEED